MDLRNIEGYNSDLVVGIIHQLRHDLRIAQVVKAFVGLFAVGAGMIVIRIIIRELAGREHLVNTFAALAAKRFFVNSVRNRRAIVAAMIANGLFRVSDLDHIFCVIQISYCSGG